MKLNLGCGRDIRPGWVNIDKRPLSDEIKELDLEDGSLPFPDGSVDHIHAHNILEHIFNLGDVLEEMLRVTRDGGTWDILTPYRLDSLVRPGHRRVVRLETFSPWMDDGRSSTEFSGTRLEVLEHKKIRHWALRNKPSRFGKTIYNRFLLRVRKEDPGQEDK